MLNPTQLKQHRSLIRYRNHGLRYRLLSRFTARLKRYRQLKTPRLILNRNRNNSGYRPVSLSHASLVNTVESSHINTPVVGEVLRDVYQNGKLIISAGTIVSSFASSGAVRDRIEVAGSWLLVFHDGRQLKVNGIACVRQANPENQQFGVEDGSAGLLGELKESDHWANAKAFIALLMTSATQAGTAAVSGRCFARVRGRGWCWVTGYQPDHGEVSGPTFKRVNWRRALCPGIGRNRVLHFPD